MLNIGEENTRDHEEGLIRGRAGRQSGCILLSSRGGELSSREILGRGSRFGGKYQTTFWAIKKGQGGGRGG